MDERIGFGLNNPMGTGVCWTCVSVLVAVLWVV